MFKKSSSLEGLDWMSISVLMVLAGVIVPSASVEAHCRATDDPMIRDCSPTIGTFSPPIAENSTISVSGKILSLAVSTDGQRLYAGAYSGVWRSDNAGETWKQLTRPQPPSDTNRVPGALRVPNIFDLAVSPENKDVVLAATATAVPGFTDTFVPDRSKNGIYRSENGGESWHLAHQFKCPGTDGAQPVAQVVFAPDNPQLVYAAGGCAIAISTDEGRTWIDKPIPDGGQVWHVAVAPREGLETGFIRRIYTAGPNQIWYSQDGGDTWLQDKGSIPPSETCCGGAFDVVGNFPSEGFQSNSARILAVEPGHPDRVFLAVPSIMNGPAYYFVVDDDKRIPDGTPCDPREPPGTGPGCGGGTLWIGDYSGFSAAQSARWQRLPGPPAYQGGSTPSGRVYVGVQPLPATPKTRPYLLFFGDTSHVHVSLGRPRVTSNFGLTSNWHRLDGRDASQSKLDNDLANKLFVHVDPHAFAVSKDFNIRLKPAEGVDFPYNLNSVLDFDKPILGTIWMANDGGVYRSNDGGMTWKLGDKLATLQPSSLFAGVSVAGKPPALYFGVPDNDNYFSLDGGNTWSDPVTGCGDCGAWFANPALPDRVIEFNRGPSLSLYINEAGGYPNAGDEAQRHEIPLPDESGTARALKGYRPLILTTQDDKKALSDTDFVLIRLNLAPEIMGRLLRTMKLSEVSSQDDWNTTSGPTVFQQGPDFTAGMKSVDVVQVSGGHENPVFYVGDPDSSNGLWKWTNGLSSWQPIVPAKDGSAKIARRFFVNPFNPKEIYIIDEGAIKRSLDSGLHWDLDSELDRAVTENGRYRYDVTRISGNSNSAPNAVIKDMIFVPNEPTRFAVGIAGVFFSLDGKNWERLLSTRALPGHPASAYFDPISNPSDRALYVAIDGRGLLRISPIPSP